MATAGVALPSKKKEHCNIVCGTLDVELCMEHCVEQRTLCCDCVNMILYWCDVLVLTIYGCIL